MAQKFNGFPGGGMGNMASIMMQAQKMQDDMKKKQAELEQAEYEAVAAGGAVKVVLSGKKEIKKLAERMKAKKVILSVTDACVEYLTDQGYSKEFGARNMARTIETKLADALVDEVLFGQLEKGGSVTADYKNKEIKKIRTSDIVLIFLFINHNFYCVRNDRKVNGFRISTFFTI